MRAEVTFVLWTPSPAAPPLLPEFCYTEQEKEEGKGKQQPKQNKAKS